MQMLPATTFLDRLAVVAKMVILVMVWTVQVQFTSNPRAGPMYTSVLGAC